LKRKDPAGHQAELVETIEGNGVAGDAPELQGLLRIVPGDEAAEDFEVKSSPAAVTGPQGWLFPPDELLLPNALNSYRKPVAAIHSVPERALSLATRKLVEALPLAVQLDLRSRSKEEAQELIRKIREDRATPLFEIRTKELGRLAGLTTSNMVRMHDTLADIVGLPFRWNVLGEDGSVEYEGVAPFLIRRDRGVGRKLGYTRFAFEPDILLWFLEPRMWANLSWGVMSGIGKGDGPGQTAAFGLYQNIWRYIGTSAKVTPAFALSTWIELILGKSRYVKTAPDESKEVVDYGDFKRRYLIPGLEILNTHPALNHTVELKEDTSGRKVLRLRFKFVEKRQSSFDFPLGWPPASLKYLEDIGFSEKDIATMSQLYLYEQVAEALKRMASAEQRHRDKGKQVYSRTSFFNGILANVAKGAAQNAEEEAKLLKAAERQQQEEADARQREVQRAKFSAHQRKLIADELQKLSVDERNQLIQEHLAAKPEDRIMFRSGGELGLPYLVLFCNWLEGAHAERYAEWLPELKDTNFESFLLWQLNNR
jgi:hypothetical protein